MEPTARNENYELFKILYFHQIYHVDLLSSLQLVIKVYVRNTTLNNTMKQTVFESNLSANATWLVLSSQLILNATKITFT